MRLTLHLFPSYSLLKNEYGSFTHEDSSYEEGVHQIQLAYAAYAGLLASFEITSLLGVGMRGEGSIAVLQCARCLNDQLTIQYDKLRCQKNDISGFGGFLLLAETEVYPESGPKPGVEPGVEPGVNRDQGLLVVPAAKNLRFTKLNQPNLSRLSKS